MDIEALRSLLSDMEYPDLQKTAKRDYNINSFGQKRESLIEACLVAAQKGVRYITDTNSDIPLGYARVRISKGNTPMTQEPVQLSVNSTGNEGTLVIERGKVVDIPIKHLKALANTVNTIVFPLNFTEGQDGHPDDAREQETDFEYTVLGMNEGPDPKPTPLEKQLQAKSKARKDFAKSLGVNWVRDKSYKELLRSNPLPKPAGV